MRILLKSAREVKSDFYGKSGWTLHTMLISYAIKQYVKLGYNISEGQDIEKAIKGIKRMVVANINPDQFSGFVCGHTLPNFGIWNDFSSAAISKSMKAKIKRLKKNNVKEELEKKSLYYDEKENRPELIAILNENIAYETINRIVEVRIAINMNSTVENSNVSEAKTKKGKGKKRENEIESENNYFRSDWALKENQEYGKKGGGKHIPEKVLELLKGFFHADVFHMMICVTSDIFEISEECRDINLNILDKCISSIAKSNQLWTSFDGWNRE
ncbi:hypothetical protein C1646_766056 [Rhizophagus diaphanus]|nr:hypothetical protein C1646_766056 [Rhizophagus diaphanus] [Rhizophagus sp. MUCL 43196]